MISSRLAYAFLLLRSTEDVENFLTDLCTPAEMKALSQRWDIAILLDGGKMSYREIAEKTGASVTTVGRVARFLHDEPYQGYRTILDRIKNG